MSTSERLRVLEQRMVLAEQREVISATEHDRKPRGAMRKRSGALDSCFGLVSPHQQSIPFPYLKAYTIPQAQKAVRC